MLIKPGGRKAIDQNDPQKGIIMLYYSISFEYQMYKYFVYRLLDDKIIFSDDVLDNV